MSKVIRTYVRATDGFFREGSHEHRKPKARWRWRRERTLAAERDSRAPDTRISRRCAVWRFHCCVPAVFGGVELERISAGAAWVNVGARGMGVFSWPQGAGSCLPRSTSFTLGGNGGLPSVLLSRHEGHWDTPNGVGLRRGKPVGRQDVATGASPWTRI